MEEGKEVYSMLLGRPWLKQIMLFMIAVTMPL
jgi:hypothetical protein